MSCSEESGGEEEETQKMVQSQNKKNKSGGFYALGLSVKCVKAATRKGYKLPTPIQRKAIPLIIDKRDVVAMARTGSGKTAAFLLPITELLKEHSSVVGMRCLILSPTRELAIQTMRFTKDMTRGSNLRIALILGGDSMSEQFQSLHDNPDIVIATPGRLVHMIHEMQLRLSSVQILVCDEADRLFEMGFAEQLNEICSKLPKERQTTLFSATLPRTLVEFARVGLREPVLVRLDADTKLSDGLKTIHLRAREEDKWAVLLHLLDQVIKTATEQTLIFLPTKHHVEYCLELLQTVDVECTYIYSSLDQAARKINTAKFINKKVNVLLVTDIAARGIDVPLLDNVINFNFPSKPKLFVHRVGRVARAGKTGTAYSLVGGDEVGFLFDLYLFLGRPLTLATPTDPGTEDDCLGVLPQGFIDTQRERIIKIHQLNCLLSAAETVYKNGYKHYLRSRGHPSSESVARAKTIVTLAAHPMFQKEGVIERDMMLEQLKCYRGKTTIFEVNTSDKSTCQEVMQRKRKIHNKLVKKPATNKDPRIPDINEGKKNTKLMKEIMENVLKSQENGTFGTVAKKAKVDEPQLENTFVTVIGPKEDYREEDVYIPYQRPGNTDAEDKGFSVRGGGFDKDSEKMTLDIVGDDTDMIKKQKAQMTWDKKKKNFVKTHQGGKKNEKMIRAEDGSRIKASYKSGRYKDWMMRNKKSSYTVGDNEESKTQSAAGIKRKRGWHYTKETQKRGDLKSVDTIIKDRKIKEKNRQQHTRGRGKGRGGSRGGRSSGGGSKVHGKTGGIGVGSGRGRGSGMGRGGSGMGRGGSKRGGRK